jgi:ABC-type nitrate/sulfonate/taurine/bicarbonate transport systems, ATPase components
MNEILKVNNLFKSYNSLNGEVKAVNDVSFSIKSGEFVSIIGPSGCGKSTILNILAGLDNDYSGVVTFRKNIRVSYMLQEDALFPWLSVFDNACLGLKVEKKLTKENISYVKELLTKYGLEDFINKKVNDLSGGMRQRVALIRTIATKPNLVLLDEPFSALDYQTRLRVSDDVYNILKEEGITAIMVTHDIGEAASISSKVIVMSKRPSKIKNVYLMDYQDVLKPLERRKSPLFNLYYDKLWRDIDEGK